jgi:hypothetical protein
MLIRNSLTIEDLQREFRATFPGLKIEFYKIEHGEEEGSMKADQYNSDALIGDIRGSTKEGEISLDPSMTVSEFETRLTEEFDLHAQIFRRSASLWLQTTATDSWTLEVQNRKGIHSMEAIKE